MRLVLTRQATEGLNRMPVRDRMALGQKLRQFAEDPYGAHAFAKAFSATEGRLRHGQWRAVYRIDKGVVTVTIVRVAHRSEVYR